MAILRTISIEKELDQRVWKYCKADGRTISGLISYLLIKYLDEQEKTTSEGK